MRLGVFGGAFNPIHLGHLLVADDVIRQLKLDCMLFVPTFAPPHRCDVQVSFADRLHMVRLALSEINAAMPCAIEDGSSGPSYTVRTLELLRERDPGASLYLVVGADQYAAIRKWHQPARLARLARIAVVSRPGVLRPPRFAGHPAHRVRFLDVVPVAIAAAAIRERVRAGHSIRCLVPSPVAGYISRRRLYRGHVGRLNSVESAVVQKSACRV